MNPNKGKVTKGVYLNGINLRSQINNMRIAFQDDINTDPIKTIRYKSLYNENDWLTQDRLKG